MCVCVCVCVGVCGCVCVCALTAHTHTHARTRDPRFVFPFCALKGGCLQHPTPPLPPKLCFWALTFSVIQGIFRYDEAAKLISFRPASASELTVVFKVLFKRKCRKELMLVSLSTFDHSELHPVQMLCIVKWRQHFKRSTLKYRWVVLALKTFCFSQRGTIDG